MWCDVSVAWDCFTASRSDSAILPKPIPNCCRICLRDVWRMSENPVQVEFEFVMADLCGIASGGLQFYGRVKVRCVSPFHHAFVERQ